MPLPADAGTADRNFAAGLAAGHTVLHAIAIEGIPYLFLERAARRVDSPAGPEVSTLYVSAVDCLHFEEGAAVAWRINRETGICERDGFDLILSRAGLEAAGVVAALFGRPTVRARVTADVSMTALTIAVASGGTDLPVRCFFGRELFTRNTGASTPTSVAVTTRGVLGVPYEHLATSPTSYRFITDRPVAWRGRRLTLYEYLVSPEGRILADDWTSDSDHRRTVCEAVIEEPAEPSSAVGMMLRCLPIDRLFELQLGVRSEVEVAMAADDPSLGWPIVVTTDDYVRIDIEYDNGGPPAITSVTRAPDVSAYDPADVSSLAIWLGKLSDDVRSSTPPDGVAGEPWLSTTAVSFKLDPIDYAEAAANGTNLHVIAHGDPSYLITITVTVRPGATPWLAPGTYVGFTVGPGISLALVPVRPPQLVEGGWLPVRPISGEGETDSELTGQGAGVVEIDGQREVIRWGDTETSGDITLLRVDERGVGGTARIDLWQDGAKLTSSLAFRGELGPAILAFLESTGTGNRGIYDDLGFAEGLGLPEAMIDVPAFTGGEPAAAAVDILAEGTASIEDLVGGWLALLGLAIVQGRQSNGGRKLTLVETRVADDPDGMPVVMADVLLDGAVAQALAPGPNVVKISTSGLQGAGDVVHARERERIQSEGARVLEVSAPGMDRDRAIRLGAAMITLSDGLATVTLTLAPWILIGLGEAVRLQTGHPLQFDWATGEWAPADVPARVVGISHDLWTGYQRVTFLCPGPLPPSAYLCPTGRVVAVPSTTQITLDSGQVATMGLVVGEDVRLYTRGNDDAENVFRQVTAIAGDTITLLVAHPVWVVVGTRVTFPDVGTSSTRQNAFMHHASTYQWSA